MFSAIAWLWTGYQMISNQERHQCGLPLSLGTSKIRFSADQDWNPCLQECSHPDAITGLHSSHRNRHTAQALACLAQWFWVGTDRAKYIYIYIRNISEDEQAASSNGMARNCVTNFPQVAEVPILCSQLLLDAAKKAAHQLPDSTDYSASPASAFRPSTSTLAPKNPRRKQNGINDIVSRPMLDLR